MNIANILNMAVVTITIFPAASAYMDNAETSTSRCLPDMEIKIAITRRSDFL